MGKGLNAICADAVYISSLLLCEIIIIMMDYSPECLSALKELHLGARGVTTDTLVRIQAVAQPAVIGSPIGRRTIGPMLSGFSLCRLSL